VTTTRTDADPTEAHRQHRYPISDLGRIIKAIKAADEAGMAGVEFASFVQTNLTDSPSAQGVPCPPLPREPAMMS
jgi:hypothetical protein